MRRAQGDRRQRFRRPEPTFARAVTRALGQARTLLDVSLGPVSYAPADREVTTTTRWPELPFHADSFDAVVTAFPSLALDARDELDAGLAELRRVARDTVVVLTRDPARTDRSWLAEYAPELVERDARSLPPIHRISTAFGSAAVTVTPLAVPFTCVDGFSEAYYARPERLLDPEARAADPAWARIDDFTARRSVGALRSALESGEWDARFGALRVRPTFDGSVVLVVVRLRPAESFDRA